MSCTDATDRAAFKARKAELEVRKQEAHRQVVRAAYAWQGYHLTEREKMDNNDAALWDAVQAHIAATDEWAVHLSSAAPGLLIDDENTA